MPRPTEASKVLSPSSPIAILKATIVIQLRYNLLSLLRKELLWFFSFSGKKPIIPKSKKET